MPTTAQVLKIPIFNVRPSTIRPWKNVSMASSRIGAYIAESRLRASTEVSSSQLPEACFTIFETAEESPKVKPSLTQEG
jgi:hypothetical protein